MKAKFVLMAFTRPVQGLPEDQNRKSDRNQAECDHGARAYFTTGIWISPELLSTPKP